MDKPIRVLQVIGTMNRGGAETMIMNLYRKIDRTKIQFDFVQNENSGAAYDDEILALGGMIYHCPRYRGKNHFSYIKWWRSFFENHKQEYPIVHGHIGSTAAIYLSIAKKHGAYTIAHSHSAGIGSGMYRFFSYPTRYIADQFFTCSKEAGISRYGRKIGTDKKRCQTLNNAIDTRKFVFDPKIRGQVRKTLHIGENTLVIGHVGRFADAKNHKFLLEIFAKVHQQMPDSALLLVGDGERRSQIESMIARKYLEGAVILTGVQPDVWNYYQAMDVFLMPSLYEGLPVSLVEAQTAGLSCCVSANVPRETAITELVQFRSLEDNAEHWAEWIIAQAKTDRQDMHDAICAAGYDISTTAQWLENFYMKVVKSRG